MLRSFKSRILFAVVALTTAALFAVTVMTWKNFKLEVEDLHKKLLRNMLGSVTNIVDGEYDELVKHELDSIGKRRMLMESMTRIVMSALKSDYNLYESAVLSENEAKTKSLSWIHNLIYGENQYFFACDMNIMGLSHPVEGMIGRKWEGFKDLKQQDALALIRDVIPNKKSGYTVLEWPVLPRKNIIKQMAYFTYFPEWEWIIGTSVRLDDIERDSDGYVNVIKKNLNSLITGLRTYDAEHIFIFDGNGVILVNTELSEQKISNTKRDMAYFSLVQCLMKAAKDPDTPIKNVCLSPEEHGHKDLTYVDYYQPLDWYIAVSVSDDVISRPVGNLIKRQLYIMLGVLLAGILLATLLSNRITGRLLVLARYARDLPTKDLAADDDQHLSDLMNQRIDDEVGQLIKAFIFMETQLRQTFRALTWESEINSAFAEMPSALIQSMHVDEISNLVLDQAKRLTGSEYGYVAYIDPGTSNLICPTLTRDMRDTCQVKNGQFMFESSTGLWGWVLINREPLLSNSPSQDPRSTGVPNGHVRIDRFLSAPALMGDTLVGQISLANPGRDYTHQDLVLVDRLASFYALAVQRKHTEDALAHSREQLRLLSSQLLVTQEEERRKIARELHDSIGQSLAAIKFNVENVLGEMDRHHAAGMVNSLERIIPVVQNAMEEARRIYTGLRPSCLDDLGIIATISWFSREFQKTYTNIWIDQHIDVEEEDIPEPLKIVIFRIVQEALNNIARHSEAEWVNLSFVRKDGFIQLTIEDNGNGFDLDSPPVKGKHEKGLGITGMKERTKLAGGVFSIESVIGEGTTIHTSWPCQNTSTR
jgi:signal transduction histidine kinase